MTDKELDRFAEQETSWLMYYGTKDTRSIDQYNDADFYDRLQSIGYAKRDTPLDRRCPASYITSNSPVLVSNIEQLKTVSGPRNHLENVFTPLEYVIANKVGRYKEFISKLKEI